MKPMKIMNEYTIIEVESFVPNNLTGKRGLVHIRPLPNQEPFETKMFVECNKTLSNDYPIGTRFRIKVKITQKQGGTKFIYSHYLWKFEVL
jgi:hypothetical protein